MPYYYNCPGYGFMDSGFGILGGIFSIIVFVFIVLLIVMIIRWIARGSRGRGMGMMWKNSLNILKERYAKGEITKEEFDRVKKDLEEK